MNRRNWEADVRLLYTEGKLVSVEQYLLSSEISSPGHRRKPNMAKLVEFLHECTLHRVGPKYLIINASYLRSMISKLGSNAKERRNLVGILDKGKEGPLNLVLHFYKQGSPITSLLGNGVSFHCLEHRCRLFHLLGLAEAVQVALGSLKIRVRFPNPVRRTINPNKAIVSDKRELIKDHKYYATYRKMFRQKYTEIYRKSPMQAAKFISSHIRAGNSDLRDFFLDSIDRDVKLVSKTQVSNRPRTTSPDGTFFRLACHYLHHFPTWEEEKYYVKFIKFSLCHRFSFEANQDLPVWDEYDQYRLRVEREPLRLFPKSTEAALERLFNNSHRSSRIRFFKHVLESKSICHTVSDDMVEEALTKHQKSLCSPTPAIPYLSTEDSVGLREVGRNLGKALMQGLRPGDKPLYDPYRTRAPTGRATIESSRQKGGSASALLGRRRVVCGSIIDLLQGEHTDSRPEPIVVGLFGPPGSGKTTKVRQLVSCIRQHLYPNLTRGECVYSRSCSTEHWDGYTGQPITILDDFGQNINDRSDLVEFEQLISCNRYPLPMAELSEKGREFESPLVIITSNLPYGREIRDSQGNSVLESDIALWRRVTLPYFISEGKTYRYRDDRLLSGSDPPVVELYTRENNSLATQVKAIGSPSASKTIDTVFDTESGSYWKKSHRTFNELFEDVKTYQESRGKTFGSESDRRLLKESSRHQPDHHRIPVEGPEQYASDPRQEMLRLRDDSWKLHSQCTDIEVFTDILELYNRNITHHRNTLSGHWEQIIQDGHFSVSKVTPPYFSANVETKGKNPLRRDYYCDSLVFDDSPDPNIKPTVKVVPLREPLKVRIITTAEADTRCLKPLQMAMFEYLKGFPQFALTHGMVDTSALNMDFEVKQKWIDRMEIIISEMNSRKTNDDYWLSGDYTAATDNFPMAATKAMVDGMLEYIDHIPTRNWLIYETSPHWMLYPDGTKLLQTSGQLMGSLISFPLLCLLNDYVVRKSGFKPDEYLINGDDVVAFGPSEKIQKWRSNAPKLGLSLSLGKNYIDKHFCCINSQLFYDGFVHHTGKASTLVRRDQSLGACFSEAQYYYGPSSTLFQLWIRKNILRLRETPQSLQIPTYLGGLGLYLNPLHLEGVNYKLAKEVYLTKYLQKVISSKEIGGTHYKDFVRMIYVPKQLDFDPNSEGAEITSKRPQSEIDFLLGLDINPRKVSNATPDLNHHDVARTRSHLKDYELYWNKIQGRSILDFPPLPHIIYEPYLIEKGKVDWIKKRVIAFCLEVLLIQIDRNRRSRDGEENEMKDQHDIRDLWNDLYLDIVEENMGLSPSLFDNEVDIIPQTSDESSCEELVDTDSRSSTGLPVSTSENSSTSQFPTSEVLDGYSINPQNPKGWDGRFIPRPSLKEPKLGPGFVNDGQLNTIVNYDPLPMILGQRADDYDELEQALEDEVIPFLQG